MFYAAMVKTFDLPMTVYTLPDDLATLRRRLSVAAPPNDEHYLVVCYCARWCDTCRDYAGSFARLAEKWPQHAFIWVDIEESPELLGDEDVENFPTLLVQTGEKNHFFGPMLPHAAHLDKLLETISRMPVVTAGPPSLAALIGT